MKCPVCDSENYHFIAVTDFDEYEATLHFKCLGKCGRDFYGKYSFLCFENEDGYEIERNY